MLSSSFDLSDSASSYKFATFDVRCRNLSDSWVLPFWLLSEAVMKLFLIMRGLLVPIWGRLAFLSLKIDLRSRETLESSFSISITF
jgi:hypothetical protein